MADRFSLPATTRGWRSQLDAPVRHARLHDARHRGHNLLGLDLKPRAVMEVLGHFKISLT